MAGSDVVCGREPGSAARTQDANGKRSYAAGYPELQDLYLAASIALDPGSGAFVLDEDGQPQLGGGGLLLRWDEVEYLDFIDS